MEHSGQTPCASPPIRLLLVDDNIALRRELRGIAHGFQRMEVVGEAGDGCEALRLVRELLPDVVLMDINMPGLSGIEATRRIKSEFPDISVIGLSVHESSDVVQVMAEAGISGYLSKETAVDDLCEAIQRVVGK